MCAAVNAVCMSPYHGQNEALYRGQNEALPLFRINVTTACNRLNKTAHTAQPYVLHTHRTYIKAHFCVPWTRWCTSVELCSIASSVFKWSLHCNINDVTVCTWKIRTHNCDNLNHYVHSYFPRSPVSQCHEYYGQASVSFPWYLQTGMQNEDQTVSHKLVNG